MQFGYQMSPVARACRANEQNHAVKSPLSGTFNSNTGRLQQPFDLKIKCNSLDLPVGCATTKRSSNWNDRIERERDLHAPPMSQYSNTPLSLSRRKKCWHHSEPSNT